MARLNATYATRAAASGEDFALPASARYLATGAAQQALGLAGDSLEAAGLKIRTLLPLLGLSIGLAVRGWRRLRRLERGRGFADGIALLACSSLGMSTLAALLVGHIISFQALYASFAVPYFVVLLAAGMIPGSSWPAPACRWPPRSRRWGW